MSDTKKYKLTDQDKFTRRGKSGETKWEIGVPVTATGKGQKLCTDQVIHYYHSAELAVLLNPIHANIENPRLFEAKGFSITTQGQLKGGCKTLTLIKELELPKFTLNQKIAFGIYCALEFYRDGQFVAWASRWLSGKDRTESSAWAAAKAAETAVRGAAKGAAAVAAARAAEAAVRGSAARRATIAAAEGVAIAAARAVEGASAVEGNIDLINIAKKAKQFEIDK